MKNPNKRDVEVAYRVKRTAEITGLKTNAIYKIIRDDRKNEKVFTVYQELIEGDKRLLEEVKRLVPFI